MQAYIITNVLNGKRYVGIAYDATKRWVEHKQKHDKLPQALYRAIRKHGLGNFAFEIVASARTWEELCETERLLIAQYGTFAGDGVGYNMTRGGEGTLGREHTAAARAKISKAHKGRKAPDGWVEKMAEINRGRKMSPENIGPLRVRNTGRSPTAAVRQRLREANLGKSHSLEARQKMSLARKGRRHSASHVANLSEAIRKDMTGMIFGQWTVRRFVASAPPRWECVCLCGNVGVVSAGSLRGGTSTRCQACRIQRLRLVHVGKTVRSETREKLRNANLGKVTPPEIKKKIAASMRAARKTLCWSTRKASTA